MPNLFGDCDTLIGEQSAMDFPVSLTERYRPARIADFAGLEKPKRVIGKLAAAPFSSNWLFVGPPGTGKTSMALALAREIRAEVHHIPSQECNLANIERVRATCQYVPMAGCAWHLVLADEINRLTTAAQDSLLSKLDGTNSAPQTIWIGTCNFTDGLSDAFKSRFHVIEFSSYGMGPACSELLQRVWHSETQGKAGLGPNFQRIVKDANNNVREALMRLETEIMCA
jgi:replication-associated recombination protein RarA